MSEEKLNLWQRINAVKKDVVYVQKDTKIEGLGKPIPVVSHDAVAALLGPAMVEHGIVSKTDLVEFHMTGYETTNYKGVLKHHNRLVCKYAVSLINIDDPEQREVYNAVAFSDDSGDKGPGIAASYATKTVHLKAFGLVTGVDDEAGYAESKAKPPLADMSIKVSEQALEEQAKRLSDAGRKPGLTLKQIAAMMGYETARDMPEAKLPLLKSHVTRLVNTNE